MSYVFISYKREDETRVGRIARSLERAGVEVWWDRGLPGGESWQANIEAKLAGAGCVVVAWSHGSVGPEGQYVRDEARRGLARGVLVPVLIDRLDALPLGFGETQAIDLSHWRGADQDPFLQDLIAAVRAKLAGAPAPAPRGPTGRLRRRLALSGVASFGAVVLCALALNLFGAASPICRLPPLQPGLSDMCGAVGLGERPTRDERLAWERLAPGDCGGLRALVARFPGGAYTARAAALLTARRLDRAPGWSPAARPLVGYVRQGDTAMPSVAASQAEAADRARRDALELCATADPYQRLEGADVSIADYDCRHVAGGYLCAADYRAICRLQERALRERCG